MARRPRISSFSGRLATRRAARVTVTRRSPPAGRLTIQPDLGIFRPGLFYTDFTRNIFETSRKGSAIVRPEDLVALRIETRNLEILPGAPPKLRKTAGGASYLILHFPPQAITEETFFEAAQADLDDPEDVPGGAHPNPNKQPKADPFSGSEPLRTPPVRARVAHESRLVFRVPDGFECAYTLEGVLDACQGLALSVAGNARPRASRLVGILLPGLFDKAVVHKLSPKRRAALAGFALRSARIAAGQGDMATVLLRQTGGGVALSRVPGPTPEERPVLAPEIDRGIRFQPTKPKPKAPGATTTSIEMPWRLILSPHGKAAWRHAAAPVHSDQTAHTELWHSRMIAPDKNGDFIRPPYPDRNRTTRAIWALSGAGLEAANPPMQSNWPDSSNLPLPNTVPFRMPMDDFDRFQISHLSSNFALKGYTPQPMETNLMMLTALGGWLDSRGAWEPDGLSVEEWAHRASMARDHYVRVVYKGYLFPFGHRVSLIKVSERKFHNGTATQEQKPGNTAYLRQRMFIVVREPEREYANASYLNATSKDGKTRYARQFPFSRIRILDDKTPDLDDPQSSPSTIESQLIFWPHVAGQPFRFQCVGTDLDGRRVAFELPLIFMDNTRACPRTYNSITQTLSPDFGTAENAAETAAQQFNTAMDKNTAPMKLQQVALAGSMNSGDTSVQVEAMQFIGETEKNNASLRAVSDNLNQPIFLPGVASIDARLGAVTNLTGSKKPNTLTWNAHYLQHGFDVNLGPGLDNVGEVFADIAQLSGMGQLDFSSQGDRSGGFVQPNLKPKALSRVAGPVMSDVQKFISGEIEQGAGFPTSVSDLPLPLLFGCIPLGEIIESVLDLTGAPEKIPKFATEASTQVESFFNALARLYGFVTDIAAQPGAIAKAALAVFQATLDDILAQAAGYPAAQFAQVVAQINQLKTRITSVVTQIETILAADLSVPAPPELTALGPILTDARDTVADVISEANATPGGVSLPAGLHQQILNACSKLDALLQDLEQMQAVITTGMALFDALDAIVGQPDALGDLLEDPTELGNRVQTLKDRIDPFKAALDAFDLLGGAPEKTILQALTAVQDILGGVGDLLKLIEMLTGEELVVRFDWNPEISSWWLPGANPASDDPIFRANDKKGFLVAVEAKVKKKGPADPKISVVCGLKHFDLILIAPASFMELNFEKIEFSVDSKAKMDVDVLLSDIKFVGPLSFVETLRDLIPLDGFSDPPYLDISAQGIKAGFDVALPSIAVGVLNISNLSLGAGFTVPFIGQPLSVQFNFCTREQPFLLTVYMFGGGGFFGVTIDPNGVQILEASFEFGASLSVDFGVASGGVSVMAGIYFRMEQDAASLTGYFRLAGHVDVLGIISASLELYLELSYEFPTGKCVGRAQLTIEISVFIFSGSVTIKCERKFAGSNGDPSLREMMGLRPDLTLEQELAMIDSEDVDYAWREHCEAFAA